jgi:N-sulfoglucosamine sulfohydrolase
MQKSALSLCLAMCLAWVFPPSARAQEPAAAKPNFLWITLEDISPNLGCYGDAYARTPHIDSLAQRGVRYTNAFATIGVCAPSRSTLITGVYAPALGTHHMRCQGTLPASIQCFSKYLRDAGYYCTNNVKTDYNFQHPKGSWDESSNKAHYKNRAKDQPFFAIFNLTTCHESQIRLPEKEYERRMATLDEADRHDPAKASIPPYHPDTPEVRKDWARYADMITFTDRRVGEILQELEQAGLADDTIVFFFSDHGAGMPRSKRWLYDSSLKVPFIVHVPERFRGVAPAKPGESTDRLISLVDVPPTMLSLAGIKPVKHMQGSAFLGKHAGEERKYIFGHRDRMDERTDMLRAVRDSRYKYIRNYFPQRPYFHEQFLNYAYEMPTLRVWQQLSRAGKLEGPQAVFMAQQKPAEELYDTQADPHEVRNLAGSPEHQDTLKRLRGELNRWQREIVDLGFLPEADLRTRFGDVPAYKAVRDSYDSYPIDRIAGLLEQTSGVDADRLPHLMHLLDHADPAVRFWGATRISALDGDIGDQAKQALAATLEDKQAWVAVAAADSLCRLGETDRGLPRLKQALQDENPWVRLQAAEAIDRLDDQAGLTDADVQRLLEDKAEYVVRVAEHIRDERAGKFASVIERK